MVRLFILWGLTCFTNGGRLIVMKRRDLEAQIGKIAKQRGLPVTYTEGGNHTRVQIGQDVTFIPRHKEIQEPTARGILATLRGE